MHKYVQWPAGKKYKTVSLRREKSG